jgi:hypothetical protein
MLCLGSHADAGTDLTAKTLVSLDSDPCEMAQMAAP